MSYTLAPGWSHRSVLGAVALALGLRAPAACAQPRPSPRYPLLRPTWEFTSWVGVGGGAIVGPQGPSGVFDLRAGGDAITAIGDGGDIRVGPFVEASSGSFASLHATGGVEAFVGAVPRPLRMFYYPGEGVFAARLGAGWAWRRRDLPGASSTPIASLTLSYGYRASFGLHRVDQQTTSDPEQRAPDRYMTGARLWAGATIDLADAPAWQVTGGIEFEPAGTLRYLLGLY